MLFGKVLPQKAFGVLVRAALPIALRVAETDLDISDQGEAAMVGYLFSAGSLYFTGCSEHRTPCSRMTFLILVTVAPSAVDRCWSDVSSS